MRRKNGEDAFPFLKFKLLETELQKLKEEARG
jgi:hypothetical protein